jgi:hypothetical protein
MFYNILISWLVKYATQQKTHSPNQRIYFPLLLILWMENFTEKLLIEAGTLKLISRKRKISTQTINYSGKKSILY